MSCSPGSDEHEHFRYDQPSSYIKFNSIPHYLFRLSKVVGRYDVGYYSKASKQTPRYRHLPPQRFMRVRTRPEPRTQLELLTLRNYKQSFRGYCSRSPDHMKYPTGGDTIIDGQKSGPARAFLVSTFNRTQLPSSTLYVSMK